MSIDPGAFLIHHPIDIVISLLTIFAIGITGIDRIKRFASLLYLLVILLKFYKHIGPMAKHYFDTHPVGQKLRRKTKIDNKLNTLIQKHQLPYDKEALHAKLEKEGAHG